MTNHETAKEAKRRGTHAAAPPAMVEEIHRQLAESLGAVKARADHNAKELADHADAYEALDEKVSELVDKVNDLAQSIPALDTEVRGLIDDIREKLETRNAFGG